MSTRPTISRRTFLTVAATASAGLVVGAGWYGYRRLRQSGMMASAPSTDPDVWLQIDLDNTITVTVSKTEMGQGVRTSMAMIVAEELDADWNLIQVQQAPAGAKYGDQFTASSASTRQLWTPLRTVGAAARELLIAAAAQTWQVEAASCYTESCAVFHEPTGRQFSYGDLAATAAQLSPPQTPQLKRTADFRLIGQPTPRIDNPQVVDGSAIYGFDTRIPGMRYATVVRPPLIGATLASFDATQAEAEPGVIEVVQISSGVAVVAETTWAALVGRSLLSVTWSDGPNAQLSSAALMEELRANAKPLELAEPGSRTIEAAYSMPHIAHAPMEPMNCVAHVHDRQCEIWAPTQHPAAAQDAAARLLNLPAESVTVHVTLAGGGFGRRIEHDYVVEAVELSRAANAPVQVVWSRDDDIKHDFYRPASHHTLRAALDENGLPVAWSHSFATPSIPWHIKRWVVSALSLPYEIAAINHDAFIVQQPVPTGAWRAVHRGQTTFAHESFLDELAAASGRDPLELRLQLVKDTRLRHVLELVAEQAGWGTPLPAGHGRGIACLQEYGSYIAQIVELSLDGDQIRVERVISAVDCGLMMNPLTVEAQIEGAVMDGLATALRAEISISNGRVEQAQYDDYGWLRIADTPVIETHLVPSQDNPGGVGELGYPAIPPAVANALFAATGKRIRDLPLRLVEG